MQYRNVIIIVSYFNFSGSRLRESALLRCLQSLPECADVLLVAMGDIPDLPRPVRLVEIKEGAILWQRERFWNIALDHITSRDLTVVWIDGDIVFPDDTWIDKLNDQLKSSALVHVVSSVTDVQYRNGKLIPTGAARHSIVKHAQVPGQLNLKDYFSTSGISLAIGCCPGFAWAAEAKLIKSIGFPDFLILGSGDKALLAAALGYHKDYAKALQLNPCLSSQYLNWSEPVFKAIANRVGYIENDVSHIVQGAYSQRQYANRYQIVASSEFSTQRFLRIADEGAWVWVPESRTYAKLVEEYFEDRHD